MTGYATAEGKLGQARLRVEAKSLNHRYLEIKARVPREHARVEMLLRNHIQNRFARGAIEIKVELLEDAQAQADFTPNHALAAHYYEGLTSLQKTLGLTDQIRTVDILAFPEVISKRGMRAEDTLDSEQFWEALQPSLTEALNKLGDMRAVEGEALQAALNRTVAELREGLRFVKERRQKCQPELTRKLEEKIQTVLQAHPFPAGTTADGKTWLESRVAQELALILDKTDIEEELTRFAGHLDHFSQTLAGGSPVGRKLDFILQELNREVNTLGNKAQDYSISEEVIALKVKIEQLREQVMNIE